jgi:hypothetical protein
VMRLAGVLVCMFTVVVLAARGATSPAPTPMPSAAPCNYFTHLYTATKESFDEHHLTAAQRSFIMAQVKTMPPPQQQYARWTRDHNVDEGIIVYDAMPIFPDDKIGSHGSWLATNTNVGFDPIECRPFITPTADVQVPPRTGRI